MLTITASSGVPRPVVAHEEVCIGEWAWDIHDSPQLPLFSPPIINGTFSAPQTDGTCLTPAGTSYLSGAYAGSWFLTSGTGTAYVGNLAGTDTLSFSFLWVGNTIMITGQLRGQLTFDPTHPPTTTVWYFDGALEVVHDPA